MRDLLWDFHIHGNWRYHISGAKAIGISASLDYILFDSPILFGGIWRWLAPKARFVSPAVSHGSEVAASSLL